MPADERAHPAAAPEDPTAPELAEWLLGELHARADADNVAGMARFGISTHGTLGVTVASVRALARDARRALGRDRAAQHELAALLWASGIHEARIMATVLDVPALVTRQQAESWALDLDSWDTCDQLCGNLLWRTAFAWDLPSDWSARPETFVKRAGFVVTTQLPKDKLAADERFLPFLVLCEREAFDPRNDVKKSVNWAIRGIGKRSAALNAASVACAERILERAVAVKPASDGSRAARWIARDALRELRSDAVRRRLELD